MLDLFNGSNGKLNIFSLQRALDNAVFNTKFAKNIKVICTEIKDSYNNSTDRILVCLVQENSSSSFVVNVKLSNNENDDGFVRAYKYWTSVAENVLSKYIKGLTDLGYNVNWD